jgi:hypothetical protein
MNFRFRYISLFILLCYTFSSAEVRYVSKTGSSTPPFTSWETAADSIQKCLNYSNWGDTIYVGNGVYKEIIRIYKEVTLIGTSMDSTVIDARGLTITGQDSLYTIKLYTNAVIKNFHIYGHAVIIINAWYYRLNVSNCILENSKQGVSLFNPMGSVENCIMILKRAYAHGIGIGGSSSSDFLIRNNLILLEGEESSGIYHEGYAGFQITGNVILNTTKTNLFTQRGIAIDGISRTEIRNNLIAGFSETMLIVSGATDSVVIENNIFAYGTKIGWGTAMVELRNGDKFVFRNNIVAHGYRGISKSSPDLHPNYNLYWNLTTRYYSGVVPGEHEIEADPMFVKDTLPGENLNFDFHLQKYSPAIDAGDPSLLDIDGSRSDIGMYGGPQGQKYGYEDLAPRTPKGLTAKADSINILVYWKPNTEADFCKYRLYSDTTAGFTADSTTLTAEITDTLFTHQIIRKPLKVYYKIAAVDSQGNQSGLSSEIGVVITSVDDNSPEVIQEYELYQNYPNPFNPSTRIPYRLKEGGFVRIVVYDITGQKVVALVNKYKEAGYHEEELKLEKADTEHFEHKGLNQLVSGIYLYRIEIFGENKIPVFNSMRKLVLIK